MVKLLLNKGCDVNVADRRSRTGLSIAMANGNNEIQKLLIDRGATVREPIREINQVAEQSENQGRSF